MVSKVKQFVSDRAQAMAEQARTLRKAPVAAARGAASRSAATVKSLKSPVHAVARSGVRLTAVSQGALQNLIELQEQIVTSALDEAAARLEGAARTENVMDLLRDQAEVLRSTRERILADMSRAVGIVAEAGRDVRAIATETYTTVSKPAAAAKPATKAKSKTKGKAKAKAKATRKSATKAKRTASKAAGRGRKAK
jgi:phasin family protein